MLGFLILHIAAILLWAATLLYLPAMIAGSSVRSDSLTAARPGDIAIARLLFTHFATPVAIIAIVAGTVVFIWNRTVEPWLIVKLSFVTGLVVVHGVLGFLILRTEAGKTRWMRLWCSLSAMASSALISGIVWMVLGIPDVENWL